MSKIEEMAEAYATLTPQPIPGPISFPIYYPYIKVSGLYKWSQPSIISPTPIPIPILPQPVPVPSPIPTPLPGLTNGAELVGILPLPWLREELCLDVDGRHPQMAASGTLFAYLKETVHWIANLASAGANTWKGSIWYKNGNTASFPYTSITIQVNVTPYSSNREAKVTFSGGGWADCVHTYKYTSAYFHTVEFEFDSATGTSAVTTMNTGDHPNRPAGLPSEALTIETIYRRVGFDVKKSGGDSVVPLSGAGANARWSDMEMHDAMQTYWSRFANVAQWSVWVFFASLHEQGTSLGGIMFDDIGPNHRQGTSIFEDAFIANPPAGETHPAAWVQRMRFWTAVHEMGHSFNLAHSWQKQHPPDWGTPWIPIPNEPEARSFMNYPYNVSGGEKAFFANFEFRFSDGELLFLRHAPARFVQPGNADWFDHHAFEQANLTPGPEFNLVVRANRPVMEFEFLEPVQLELKLTNISNQPKLLPENILLEDENLTVILKKKGRPAREYRSYVKYCRESSQKALLPGDSLYAPLSPYAGLNGMDMIEPGYYTVQVALHLPSEEDILSNQLNLRVLPPLGYTEEYLAQDFYNDEVGRLLSIGGSKFLSNGINTLQEVASQLAERRVALHARLALANPSMREYKTLEIPAGEYEMQPSQMIKGARIHKSAADPDTALREMSAVLVDNAGVCAETLGHINYRQDTEFFTGFLAEQGAYTQAGTIQESLHAELEQRKVLPSVLKEIKNKETQYEKKAKAGK